MREYEKIFILYNKTNSEYFNGVKGKYVRWTKDFRRAKPLKKDGTLCDRDKGYLERYFEMYDLEIVEAKYSIEFELEGK